MDIQGITPRPPRRPAVTAVSHAQGIQPKKSPAYGSSKLASPGKTKSTLAASKSKPVNTKFALPVYHSPQRAKKIVRKRLTKKRLFVRVLLAVLLLGILTAGSLAWIAYANVRKAVHGTRKITPALSAKEVTPDLLKGEGDGRVNILLMGVGGPGHAGADLTDTLVVFSVDPVNNTATMLSVPRDLWVKMPAAYNYFGSVQKINAAYESGKYKTLGHVNASNDNQQAVEAGLASIDLVMKDILDITINYHVLVNFQAFRQAIDTVGGVTVNVPERLYDPTMAWENKWNPVLAEAGVQQMDGVKALMYARSRETSSDFARGERQRRILLALKDKVLSAGTLSNPVKIAELMGAFGSNVYTDMSVQGASRLYSIMKKVDNANITSLSFVDPPHKLITTDRVGNASVDRPIAGFFEYGDIQSFVHSQLPDGYLVKEKASVVVMGSTAATAAAVATTLTNYGYNVTGSSSLNQPATQPMVVDLSKGKAPFTRNYLEKRYNVKAVAALPSGVTLPTLTDATGKLVKPKFVIIETK